MYIRINRSFRKGEILTAVVVGSFLVMGVASIISTVFFQKPHSTTTRAASTPSDPTKPACSDRVVQAGTGAYWKADCNKQCWDVSTHSDCPANPNDPSGVPATSNWCYRFNNGQYCMQRVAEAGNNPQPQPSAPQAGVTCKPNCDNKEKWVSDCLKFNGSDKTEQCNNWFTAECSSCNTAPSPTATTAPVAPADPVAPVDPVAPADPAAPVAPADPVAPSPIAPPSGCKVALGTTGTYRDLADGESYCSKYAERTSCTQAKYVGSTLEGGLKTEDCVKKLGTGATCQQETKGGITNAWCLPPAGGSDTKKSCTVGDEIIPSDGTYHCNKTYTSAIYCDNGTPRVRNCVDPKKCNPKSGECDVEYGTLTKCSDPQFSLCSSSERGEFKDKKPCFDDGSKTESARYCKVAPAQPIEQNPPPAAQPTSRTLVIQVENNSQCDAIKIMGEDIQLFKNGTQDYSFAGRDITIPKNGEDRSISVSLGTDVSNFQTAVKKLTCFKGDKQENAYVISGNFASPVNRIVYEGADKSADSIVSVVNITSIEIPGQPPTGGQTGTCQALSLKCGVACGTYSGGKTSDRPGNDVFIMSNNTENWYQLNPCDATNTGLGAVPNPLLPVDTICGCKDTAVADGICSKTYGAGSHCEQDNTMFARKCNDGYMAVDVNKMGASPICNSTWYHSTYNCCVKKARFTVGISLQQTNYQYCKSATINRGSIILPGTSYKYNPIPSYAAYVNRTWGNVMKQTFIVELPMALFGGKVTLTNVNCLKDDGSSFTVPDVTVNSNGSDAINFDLP